MKNFILIMIIKLEEDIVIMKLLGFYILYLEISKIKSLKIKNQILWAMLYALEYFMDKVNKTYSNCLDKLTLMNLME